MVLTLNLWKGRIFLLPRVAGQEGCFSVGPWECLSAELGSFPCTDGRLSLCRGGSKQSLEPQRAPRGWEKAHSCSKATVRLRYKIVFVDRPATVSVCKVAMLVWGIIRCRELSCRSRDSWWVKRSTCCRGSPSYGGKWWKGGPHQHSVLDF